MHGSQASWIQNINTNHITEATNQIEYKFNIITLQTLK